jgi:hypothetical protein
VGCVVMAMKRKRKKMDAAEVRSILSQARNIANSYNSDGIIASERIQNLRYYRGEPFGNEIKGRSQVISRDVLDTVEEILPELIEIFVGGSEVVKFNPISKEGEKMASLATTYCGHVFFVDNPGFMILYTWFKDALVQKNGFVKVIWEENEEKETQHLKGLSLMDIEQLVKDKDADIEEQRAYRLGVGDDGVEYEQEAEDDWDEQDQSLLFEVKVCHYKKRGVNKIYATPPEEFGISPRASSLEKPEYCFHQTQVPASDLVVEYPKRKKDIDTVKGWTTVWSTEKGERFSDEDLITGSSGDYSVDRSMRLINRTEWYIHIDEDGDGIGELRRIVACGDNDEIILEDEEIDEHPFVDITPIPEPHKVFGMAIADLVKDIQLIKSTIMRQMLDNIYLTNNQRPVIIPSQVNVDDVLDSRPGAPIRAKSLNAIHYLETPTLSQDGLGMLNKLDEIREGRTGVHRNSRGLDIDRLHDTAQGIAKLMDKLDKRKMLIARIFAEMGVAPLFKKILRNLVKYQDEARSVQLNDEWVDIDPRTWQADMNVTAQVGLGTGNKEETLANIKEFLAIQKELLTAGSPMVTPKELYASLDDYVKASGKKNTGRYFVDPSGPDWKPQQPKPDIEIQKAQIQAQSKKYEIDTKAKLERQRMDAEIKMGREKMAMEVVTKNKQPAQRPGGNVGT